MSDPLMEMAEFAGKACGTIVKDVADISKPLAEAFRRGWREALGERPASQPASSTTNAPNQAPESA